MSIHALIMLLVAMSLTASSFADDRAKDRAGDIDKYHLPSLKSQAKVFSKAAGLSPLTGQEADELRFWIAIDDHRSVIAGYVVQANTLRVCKLQRDALKKDVAKPVGACAEEANPAKKHVMLAAMEQLAALNNQELICKVLDGYYVVVEGVHAQKLFTFSASNPDECSDAASVAVTRIVAALWQR